MIIRRWARWVCSIIFRRRALTLYLGARLCASLATIGVFGVATVVFGVTQHLGVALAALCLMGAGDSNT